MNLWQLPETASIGGREYPIHTDFREILQILGYLADESRPEFIRWHIALALFYDGDIPAEHCREAMEYLADFIRCGAQERPGPRRFDWEQDAAVILSDVNRVAGREVRAEKHLHWWTFLSFFHAIGEGQLSQLVAIRDKLRRGQRLEQWEQEYYRENKDRVRLRRPESAQETREKQRLIALLDGC